MRERLVEKLLIARVKERGGYAPKFVSPGTAGMPDRVLIFPGGRMGFVEVKAPGEKPRPLQVARHEQLRSYDAKVFILDSLDIKDIDRIIDEIQAA